MLALCNHLVNMLIKCYHVLMKTLKELREKQCLSQSDLAKKSKVTVATINRIEHNKNIPIPRTKRKLASALGVDPSEISW